MDIRSLIRNIPDFPQSGIIFRDITPVLANPDAFGLIVDHFVDRYRHDRIDAIAGIEARGFLLAAPVAYRLAIPLIPVRKEGKLPFHTRSIKYELEYGQNVIEMHVDAISEGSRIAIMDDLLATGGTLSAAAKLVESLGGEVAELGVIVELGSLSGSKRLERWSKHSYLTV